MRIRSKLYLAFGGMLLLAAITSIVIVVSILGIQDQFREFHDTQLRLSELADDIRFYDSSLTDAVRAYLIDPQDQAVYDRYYQDADALDAALKEAQELATNEEDRQLFANIDVVNVELVNIEESLLANPDMRRAVSLYRGTYGELKEEYSTNVKQFFSRQRVALEAETDQILSVLSQTVTFSVGVLIGLIIIGSALALILSRNISNPLISLTQATEKIAGGELDTPLPPAGQDEIGVLTQSFGTMVQEIRKMLKTVEYRANELQTVADVSRQVSTILEVDRLLQDVVDITKERFRLYHAHVYSLNEAGDTLVLTSGAGHVGREMVSENRIIAMDNPQSIVAQAANTRHSVAVDDVTQSPTFLPHPRLPETRSEFALPLVARGQLLGVLDVQSDAVGYFTDEVRGVLELMASQISTAVSNARLFEVADRTSRHEQALGAIDRKLQDAVDMDEILQVAVRELGKALRVPYTAVELQPITNGEADLPSEETSTFENEV
jgi:putative methionine-R-sulfoxide reductase with GAF domain